MLFILMILQLSAFSQSYKNRIGVRLGYQSGFTYQHQYQQNRAFETIFSFSGDQIKLTCLTEWVNPVRRLRQKGWSWHYGFGGHTGIQRKYVCEIQNEFTGTEICRYELRPVIGFDGVFGMEYTFDHIPLSIGGDYKPSVNVLDQHNWPTGLVEFGFNCRYVF